MNRIQILRAVFEQWNQLGIKYCVLRNYDFLLENRLAVRPSEQSVDLVVAPEDFSKLEKVLLNQGFQRRTPSYSRRHWAYFYLDSLKTISFDLQIGGVYWNDQLYLKAEPLLAHRVKKSFFYVPADNDTFILLLTHSILGKRYFKPEYQALLIKLFPVLDREYVSQQLATIFNRAAAHWLLEMVAHKKFEQILKRKYNLIRIFIFKSPQSVWKWVVFCCRYAWWQDYFSAYLMISIIGPDGAGKTTMAEALAGLLRQHQRKVKLVYTGRGRNNFLPIGKIGRRYKNKEKIHDETSQPQLGRRKIFYTLMAFVFTADLLLRYVFEIMPRRRRRCIVITDRYCSDILLMNHVPLGLKKWLLKLFPKPTMTFYVYNSADILHSRRTEEPVPELQRQMELFDVLRPYLKPIEIVTSNPQQDIERVGTLVMAYLYREWY